MTRAIPAILIGASLMTSAACSAKSTDIVKPRALENGGTIALVAPASPSNDEVVEYVSSALEAQGYTVRIAGNVTNRLGYLAGTDEERARSINEAFADPEVDAIFSLSGGYGVTRMLPLLDFDVIRANPKILTGFSDITGLHLAIQAETGLVTFHTPTHSRALGRDPDARPMQTQWLWRHIHADSYRDAAGNIIAEFDVYPTEDRFGPPVVISPGVARGRLTGGNLSLIHALAGTPYAMDTKGTIIFIEDVGEEPYRIDRMLSNLELSGALDTVAGVVLGRFARCEPKDPEKSLTLEEVFQRYFAGKPYPVIFGFPTGHVEDNVTLPYGVMAELDADAGTLRLLENPVQIGGR